MKNHFVSAVAGWKSAALLALVAMLAAVAFSGVLTGAQPTQAQAPQTPADLGTTVQTYPGGTTFAITGIANSELANFSLEAQSTARGTFVASGLTSVICADWEHDSWADPDETNVPAPATSCDKDGNNATIKVQFAVDANSPAGILYFRVSRLQDATGPVDPTLPDNSQTRIAWVTPAPAGPTSLIVTPLVTGIDVGVTEVPWYYDPGAGQNPRQADRRFRPYSGIQVRVETRNAQGGIVNGQPITASTDNGNIACGDVGYSFLSNQWIQLGTPTYTQVCAGPELGYWTGEGIGGQTDQPLLIRVYSSGRTGPANITITHPTLGSQTVTARIFGTATNLSASALQGAVELTGDAYVLLTVTDAQGNAVRNAAPRPAAANAVVPPGPDQVGVTLDINSDMPAIPGVYPAGLPACGNDTTAGTNHDAGTNDMGQCVVKVSTSLDDTSTAANELTALGTNLLNFILGPATAPVATASASISVAGSPASLAVSPASGSTVAGLSETEVMVTVRDSSGVLVADTEITILKVEGEGIIGDGSSAVSTVRTVNGVGTFSYIAGPAPDNVVFSIRAKSAASGAVTATSLLRLTVSDGDDMAAGGWSAPVVSGWQNIAWQGEDGASVADNIPAGVTAVWYWNGGGWDAYFPAAGVPSANTLSELRTGKAYWVISN